MVVDHQLRLWADFNELDGDRIRTTLRRAGFIPTGEPRPGQWVELWDHQGDKCWGRVISVDFPIVHLQLNLSTWVDGDAVELPPLPTSSYTIRSDTFARGAVVPTGT